MEILIGRMEEGEEGNGEWCRIICRDLQTRACKDWPLCREEENMETVLDDDEDCTDGCAKWGKLIRGCE